jgi:hypothetical protein
MQLQKERKMQDQPSLQTVNPSVLIYRGLDAEALVALQMRNLEALRRLAVVALRGAEIIATRQIEMAQRNIDQFNHLAASSEGERNFAGALAKQVEMFEQALGTLAADTRELTELSCKCGCDMFDQMATTLTDPPSSGMVANKRDRMKSEKD